MKSPDLSYQHLNGANAMNKTPLIPIFVYLAFSLLNTALALDIQPERGNRWINKNSLTASEFMITTANPMATQVGYDILEKGGTAIDAAVAVQLMLNLVEPQSSGLGGGTFLLYWDAGNKNLVSYDGRETAPAAAKPDYFLDQNGAPMDWWKAVKGGRSVGVPGTLKLLEAAHEDYGSLAWPTLFTPTIKLARKGFEVSPRLAASIKDAKTRGLMEFKETRSYFFDQQGDPLKVGSLLRNPLFAATLEAIAEDGSKAFYTGELAQAMVDKVRNHGQPGGLITLEDLAAYRAVIRSPVCSSYRKFEVCGMGPPSSGALTVGQILGILEHFDLPEIGMGVDAVQLYSEAAKLAYADRSLYIADSDFISMPTTGLLNKDYLKQRARLVSINHAMDSARPGSPPWSAPVSYTPDKSPELPGTSHISIVDKQGNIVSMTTSIETGFGSRLMVGGFLLNNEMTDFSFRPSLNGRPVANRVEGGKRPRSSMAPTIVFKGDRQPVLVIGSPGGSRIINYVAKTIIAVLDWNMDIQEAVNLGHFSNRNGATDLELNTRTASLKAALEQRGQQVNILDLNSGLHGIVIMDDKRLTGAADPRREGTVMGE